MKKKNLFFVSIIFVLIVACIIVYATQKEEPKDENNTITNNINTNDITNNITNIANNEVDIVPVEVEPETVYEPEPRVEEPVASNSYYIKVNYLANTVTVYTTDANRRINTL